MSAYGTVEIPVEASGVGDAVVVQVAATLDSEDPPAEASKEWRIAGIVDVGDLPTTVESPSLLRGRTVWYRASAWEDGVRVSVYTEPASVDLPLLPLAGDLSVSVDEAGAVAFFELDGSADGADIRWAIHDEGDEPSYGDSEEVDPDLGAHFISERAAFGQQVTVELTPTDSDEETEGDPLYASATRPFETGTTQEPEHWLFTTEGRPVRASNFHVVMEAGLSTPDDWILTTAGAPVRRGDLTPIRSTE